MGSRAGRSVSSVSDTLRAECPVTPSREHDRLLLSAAEAASRVARYRIHAEALADGLAPRLPASLQSGTRVDSGASPAQDPLWDSENRASRRELWCYAISAKALRSSSATARAGRCCRDGAEFDSCKVVDSDFMPSPVSARDRNVYFVGPDCPSSRRGDEEPKIGPRILTLYVSSRLDDPSPGSRAPSPRPMPPCPRRRGAPADR